MTKAFSILHRAAALLVALCLLVGMALPVYAAEDEALFFDAGSETIPTIPAADTSSKGVEPAQEPIVTDSETVPGKENTPPAANEPKTETETTVQNTETVPNNDGKTQEAAENQTPAADTDTAPADPALTNKTPADTSDTAAAPNHAINAEETTAAKTNTEQDVLFADGDNPNEEDTMLADDLPDNDDANTPDTIADTSASTGFIPATTTIYFEDDGTYDKLSANGGNCTMRFLGFTGNGTSAYINKVMEDTETTVTGQNTHKIFSITLNSADYPAGGFYRIAFQYYIDNNNTWKEEINAFGRDDGVNDAYLTAIDLLAGKKFVRTGNETSDNDHNHFNQNQKYNPSQWTRVEYYYKDTPLYFKNASGTVLTNVTATFYKLENSALAPTGSQTIGTVDADKLAAQQIRIPDNQSRFVQFTWNNGQSALYDFTTDSTAAPYADAQKLDLTAANCYVYNDTTSTWASAGGDLLTAGKKIYFDATLSSYGYEGEGLQQQPMPGIDNKMFCFLTDSENHVTSKEMTLVTADSTTPARKLWSCEIPDGEKTYTAVQFSATDNQNAPAKDNKTRKYSTAEIPPTLQEPCFFADDGDPSAYTGGEGVNRDGYWGEKASVRDAESGKNAAVVDIDNSGIFTQQKDTKYITSTLYDYYTDYELNGLNRDTYPDSTTSSQRGYVTFEQFNRALSSAYTANDNVKYPLYTGHFQPSINGWGNPFATVAAGMGLYGWSNDTNSPAYKTFMAVNNSALDDSGNGSDDYNRTFQGLVESKTSDGTANGLPLLRTKNSTTNASVDPHFDKDFLQGKNAFNTVLGKVYEDVSFPLKQKPVFAQNPDSPDDNDPESKAEYWYYDSNETSLYLKQDSARQSYYLAGNGTKDDASLNRGADNSTNGKGYGFFPFNETVTGSAPPQYNYGFGAKLQFDFTLTEDGKVVVGKDTSGRNIEVPIKFFFSGDDDVWVYIDGKLMLDVGGAHGKASGLLEFGANNTVTPYVSSNKNTDQNDTMVYGSGETTKTVNYNGQPITFNKKGTTKTLENQSTHTLTMYYMERGMWESNMALAFNFPDHNELQVEKQVDVSDVNPLFRDSFKNQKIFTFNIQNLATHYETKGTDKPKIQTYEFPNDVYSSVTGLLSYESSLPENVDKDKGSAVLWSSDKSDPSSLYRDQRRGTLTWDTAIDISPYSYLTFDVYVQGESTETCALSNLYVELWDTNGKQMGCLGTKGLQSSDVYGAATALHPGTWYTVRLMLNSLKQVEGFDKTQLKSITVGDNYARSIYLRNFTFSSAPTLPKQTGFTTAQYNVPDYGSAESGKLENAAYAVFSSNLGNGDVVDENGRFLLQDGETVTFNDQFRRGSYIALQEQIDTELYDTTWTVYENDVPVTSVNGKKDVVTTGSVSTLQNVSGTAPNDGRTEKVVDVKLDGHNTKNEYIEANKPSNALVFRSYSSSADGNELTKLKVVFNNKVKTGKLIIRKVPAEDETLEGQEFTFTVRFGDVGGQSLGDTIEQQTYTCTVKQHGDEYYGEIVIDKIPVGTRFVVSEKEQPGTSLKSVSIDGGKDCAVAADGVKVYGAIAEGEANAATATFENTARELIDITVKKEWKTQDGKADIPQADLPNAIYLQLQRTETPDEADSWLPVSGYKSVELKKPDGYEGWTKQFTGLDKYDANKAGNDHVAYTYRVLERATADGKFYGGADGDVIEINGKKYKVLNTTVTGDSADKTLTLTNQLQDAKYNLVITKQDAQDPKTKLGGVEFKLEKPDAVPSETKTGKTAEETGELTFADLTPGSYRLTETKTAEGYTLLAEPIEFTLTADGRCLRGDETFGKITPGADGVYNIALTVYNRKGFTLPHTGADAPSLWLLIGLPALVAVLLVLVFRYNKKGGKRS